MREPGAAIRVLHVIESLGRGGAERSLVDRVARGDPGRLRHHVVALLSDDALVPELRAAGAAVDVLGGRGRRDLPSLTARLAALIRRVRPDVVHTQLVSADIAGRAAALLGGGVPVVSTLQNMPYDPRAHEVPAGWRGSLIKHADAALGRWTRTRYLAVSEAVRASYRTALGIPAERIEVVYNAVDHAGLAARAAAARARPALRAALGLPPGRRLIVTVARHVPQKGLEFLIDALARPPLVARDVRLALVGTGGLTAALQSRAAERGVGPRVQLLGRREDVVEILAAADVFALPSLYEGLPVALLEALAAGVPAVASDIPEIREVTTAAGARLVPPGDADALARGLAEVLEDPTLAARLAAEGSREVRERFDVVTTTRRFEAVLLAAAQGARRATSE